MNAQDPIRLREFRASDLEALLRLIHDTIDVYYTAANGWTTGRPGKD
jgi:hypothetical protein